MFCNQCGKENKDGTKFCVQCGTPLKGAPQRTDVNNNVSADSAVALSSGSVSAGKKSLLVIALILVLLLIAVINILKVQMAVTNIPIRDELQRANSVTSTCETNSYIYYVGSSLFRMDKGSHTVSKVSNKYIYPVTATNNAVYGTDSNGNWYKCSDKSAEIEKVDYISSSSSYGDVFLSGRYHYYVSVDGTITKKLNSEKFSGYSTILYNGESGDSLIKAELYKGYIYMILADSDSSSDRTFIRVSLKTGKKEQLTDYSIAGFSFDDNRIVCNDVDGGFFVMNLSGGNEQEYVEVDNVKYVSFICANGYVYYSENNKLYRFSIDGGEVETLGKSYYGLMEIEGGGFVYNSGDELTLLDYDGNEFLTLEP